MLGFVLNWRRSEISKKKRLTFLKVTYLKLRLFCRPFAIGIDRLVWAVAYRVRHPSQGHSEADSDGFGGILAPFHCRVGCLGLPILLEIYLQPHCLFEPGHS